MTTRRRIWPVISILIGAAFAIEAVTNADGTVLTVTAIAAGMMYAIVGSLTRGDGRRVRNRNRNR